MVFPNSKILKFSNFKSRVVNIGGLTLGGDNPIRIQSMTSTKTLDTDATVEQTIRLIDAGCDLVRITAQSAKEGENLANIKNELKKRGYNTPLVADIHFNPEIAEIAARIVEKVRINPGNYVDRKAAGLVYNDAEYKAELMKIREKLSVLISICKEHSTALRIGSNHGSLSERIVTRYGDTPMGMVEAALEFVRMCREMDFHNLVISMKASNVKIMVESNRLLVNKMIKEGMDYPIHLGVTEAGDEEDGKIKSAAGIGTLLEDGIGNTIRVSLCADPVKEVPVAIALANRYKDFEKNINLPSSLHAHASSLINPFEYTKRKSIAVGKIGGHNPVIVIENLSSLMALRSSLLVNGIPSEINFITLKNADISDGLVEKIKKETNPVIIYESDNNERIALGRELYFSLLENNIHAPVILKRNYKGISFDKVQLYSAIDFSTLLVDGFGDGIWIETELGTQNSELETQNSELETQNSELGTQNSKPGTQNSELLKQTAFNILQVTGVRISKTEFVACPSCGRTNFNLEEAFQKVKARTQHLTGLKIAVMGCIVNGPGEMADAHYGYVGVGKAKITLYKGKEIVKKNIDEDLAVEELINLIKSNNDWKEPEVTELLSK